MEDRATIICSREGKVLLVARARSRWSLPGGSIKRSESPLDAARRELEEETSLVGAEFTYLFEFGGLSKRHLVFFVNLPQEASPEPRHEISRCKWFSPIKISTLVTSVPTREIVDLFFTHENRGETPSAVIDKSGGRGNGTGQPCTQVADAVSQ
ncbi:NUDIX hydrolase [Paraburkholderia dipogonis]|uniref:NUDIX hydrolase n=1 Tax=Paraburkholderia dipogonis TaxID=1211383 RepID=UPI0038BB04A3